MYQKQVLDNGVRIITEEVPGVHSAAVGIWVRTGSRHEDESIHGISHFLEHMLFKGTPKRSARRIAEELESVGGSLNAFTTKEYTCYYAKVLADHLDMAIDVLADMFFNSILDPKEIEKEKNVILEEIKMYEDSPDEVVHDLFARTVWDGHPLGRTILGTTESVMELQRDKLVSYLEGSYTVENTVVAVAGKIKHLDVVEKLNPYFTGLKYHGRPGEELISPTPRSGVVMEEKDLEQVQICLGTPGLSQQDKNIYVLHVLNNVLGGGLSSRLFQEIREERGLAYSVYSYQTAYADTGLFTVYAGTSPGNVQEVLELIVRELNNLKHQGITREELERSKQQLKGSLLLSMENVNNRMTRLGKTEVCFGRVITVDELLARINEVELDDVHNLARELFAPDKFTYTSIGPFVGDFDLNRMWKKEKG
ncbi:zinc protease [Clostridiales bacterium PH28_bin88]|nr:zinc protease [Clostridiales bacterium PH28_bin88]